LQVVEETTVAPPLTGLVTLVYYQFLLNHEHVFAEEFMPQLLGIVLQSKGMDLRNVLHDIRSAIDTKHTNPARLILLNNLRFIAQTRKTSRFLLHKSVNLEQQVRQINSFHL